MIFSLHYSKIKGNESKLHHFYLKMIASCISKAPVQCLEVIKDMYPELEIVLPPGAVLSGAVLSFPLSPFFFFFFGHGLLDSSSKPWSPSSMASLHSVSGQFLPSQEYHSYFTITVLIQVCKTSEMVYFKRLLSDRTLTPAVHFVQCNQHPLLKTLGMCEMSFHRLYLAGSRELSKVFKLISTSFTVSLKTY